MGYYRAFSLSTAGASHIKNCMPCQDASHDNDNWRNGSDCSEKNVYIAAVADGHGSPQYFRSDIGSRVAVETTFKGFNAFIDHCANNTDAFIAGNGKELLSRLAKYIISSWYTSVLEDALVHPLAEDERIREIDQKYRDNYLNDPEHQNFSHAYGSTLIAIAMSDEYWFGMQIGDGKCVVLYEDGSWDQPIPWDDQCFLNATTSICDDGAIDEFRYWYGFQKSDGTFCEYRYGADGQMKDSINESASRPIAIFIGTDGVDDTFPMYDNENYLKFLYQNILLQYIDKGYDEMKIQVLKLVEKIAEQGSRDDVSIAGIIGDLHLHAGLIDSLRSHDNMSSPSSDENIDASE